MSGKTSWARKFSQTFVWSLLIIYESCSALNVDMFCVQ